MFTKFIIYAYLLLIEREAHLGPSKPGALNEGVAVAAVYLPQGAGYPGAELDALALGLEALQAQAVATLARVGSGREQRG